MQLYKQSVIDILHVMKVHVLMKLFPTLNGKTIAYALA